MSPDDKLVMRPDGFGRAGLGTGGGLEILKILRSGKIQSKEAALDSLYALGRRIRNAGQESELSEIENQIDEALRGPRAGAATGDENAVDAATLNVAAQRLENLIHDRRAALSAPSSEPRLTTRS